jgi:F-type H+-transporting ATPase subunit b
MAETTTHEGTQAPGGAHEGGHGSFPPFDNTTFASQLVWLAIAFGALYLLMSRIALPRVAAILGERETKLASDLAAAGQMKSDADAAIAAYEKALADAKARAQTIAAETRDRLNAESEARRKTVEADLAKKLHAAEEVIAKGRIDAMANVRSIAADAATAIIQRLVGQAPTASDVSAAVAKATES